MRILQLGSGMPGWAGTEKAIIELSKGLLERGHRVAVACPRNSVLESMCQRLHIPRITLQMRNEWDWRQLPSFVRAMWRAYDIVNVHGYRDYIIPPLAARVAGVPAVVMTRRLPHRFRSGVRAALCSYVFYDRIIAVSRYVAKVMEECGVPRRRLCVVYNGVVPPVRPRTPNELRAALGVPGDALVFGAAGRLTKEKGFDVLLRAMRGVKGHCLIAGGGAQYDRLQSLAREIGVWHKVHFLGLQKDMSQFWHDIDVAVVPSLIDETFCRCAVEAMCCGKPVVASNVGAIPEVCGDGCALLISPGDVQALREALIRIEKSAGLRAEMGRKAIARAAYFSVSRMVEETEAVYRRLLRRRGWGRVARDCETVCSNCANGRPTEHGAQLRL